MSIESEMMIKLVAHIENESEFFSPDFLYDMAELLGVKSIDGITREAFPQRLLENNVPNGFDAKAGAVIGIWIATYAKDKERG